MDGDAEQRRRRRSIRRRSLAISIAVQSAILTALILVSLFGKPQSIALANVTPVPPYSQYRNTSQNSSAQRNSGGTRAVCHIWRANTNFSDDSFARLPSGCEFRRGAKL